MTDKIQALAELIKCSCDDSKVAICATISQPIVHVVRCMNCDASTGMLGENGLHLTEEDAVETWNKM